MPFQDQSADVVLLFAVLTCIIDPRIEPAILSEIYRILKPDGKLIINDFLFQDDNSGYEFREDVDGK